MEQAVLRICHGTHAGHLLHIGTRPFRIGRADGCQLKISSHTISRNHCELQVVEGRLVIRDLNSRNGTRVNGEQLVAEQPLQAGDHVVVGPVDLEVELVPAARPSAPQRSTDEPDSAADLALGDLVHFDDEATGIEETLKTWEWLPGSGTTIADLAQLAVLPDEPAERVASPTPATGDDATRDAARKALKRMFRGKP